MRYRVDGINRATGTEVSLTIGADSVVAAEAMAEFRGVEVHEVRQEIEGDEDALARAASSARSSPAPPKTVTMSTPYYAGILLGAGVLRVMAVIWYLTAGFMLISVLTSALSPNQGIVLKWEAVTFQLAGVLGFAAGGAILHMLASLSIALRDIARNSFVRK
jgi:hypothetical protein